MGYREKKRNKWEQIDPMALNVVVAELFVANIR